jgi:hypothetical protein
VPRRLRCTPTCGRGPAGPCCLGSLLGDRLCACRSEPFPDASAMAACSGPDDIAHQTEGTFMIQARLQRSFGEGLIAEAVDDLWEDWIRHADEVLEDESLINTGTRVWRVAVREARPSAAGAYQLRWSSVCCC